MTVINTYDRPAGDIKVGNYLFSQKVVAVKPKIKKINVELEQPVAGTVYYEFRMTDMLEVGVVELTEEEQTAKAAEELAERKEYFVKQVRNFVDIAKAQVDKAHERQGERVAAGWGLLDHYTLDLQLTAYADFDLAREIEAVFNSAADGTFHLHEGECEYYGYNENGNRVCTVTVEYDDYAVAVHIANRMVDRLTRMAMSARVLSRSTSFTSNLCEDLQRVAVAGFINSLQYSSYGLDEVKLLSR